MKCREHFQLAPKNKQESYSAELWYDLIDSINNGVYIVSVPIHGYKG